MLDFIDKIAKLQAGILSISKRGESGRGTVRYRERRVGKIQYTERE